MSAACHEADFVESADGTRIAFHRVGAGQLFVVVHGGLASWQSWLPVAEAFADRVEWILYDRRGRGKSGDAAAHSLDREVEDLAAVLEAVGPVAGVAGHSYGGSVLLRAALALPPESLGRLVLYEPGLVVPPFIARFPEVQERIDAGELEDALTHYVENVAQMTREEVEAARSSPAWPALVSRIVTLPREIAAIETLGFDLEQFRAVAAPVLLLVGEESPPRQHELAAALLAVLPAARLETLAGAAHVASATAPELLGEAVCRFLDA